MNDSDNHVDTDNLDDFAKDFFQIKEPEKATEEEKPKAVEEVTETPLETDEDIDADAPKEEAKDDEPAKEPEEESKPKGRKSAKERIDELTTEKYELRRELEALRRDFEASRTHKEEVKEEAPVKAQLPEGAPDPDAVDKDGNPIYRLGEFDPQFIRDITKFAIAEETKAAKEAQAQETARQQAEAAQREIADKWTANLQEAEKEIPDIRENIGNLVEVFSDVEPTYGEYLASVLMESDYGPAIMNYLSENIGEAQKIVASGPAAATLAIGRLEARFVRNDKAEEQPKKKVSNAPEPAPTPTRGSGGRFTVTPDTDDLDAFEREFFKKTYR